MGYMFAGCNSLQEIDISNFDTTNVEMFDWMFAECYEITELDLTNISTQSAINIGSMFRDMTHITKLKLGPLFTTENVEEFGSTFMGCISLVDLDISMLHTSNATSTENMFKNDSSIVTLVLGENFDTSNVTQSYEMFKNMTSLKTIYVTEKFDTSNITSSYDMFLGDTELKGGSQTAYSSAHIDAEYARIDDPTNGKPGYFTLKTN
jgi:surface protein